MARWRLLAGPRGIALALWLTFVALCAVVIAHTEFRADFSAFLPSRPTPQQRLLVEQLQSGAGSGLLLAGIEAAPSTPSESAHAMAARLATLSRALAARLRNDALFSDVLNGEADGNDADRKLLFEHRYLLSPKVDAARFSVDGLRAAAQDSIAEIASSGGLMIKQLLPRDPTGELLALLERLLPASGGPARQDGVWFDPPGRTALLLIRARVDGNDIDAQQRAIGRLRAHYRAALDAAGLGAGSLAGAVPRLLVSGPGTFAVASRDAIKSAVERLSLVGSLLILSLLYTIYRSVAALALGIVPVVTGVLAGIAAVSIGFGTVHGITLGFGATLVGEAVDYAIYLFVQRGGNGSADDGGGSYSRSFWPTIRLGVLTSVCGFSALLLSGFPGLAQLGAFSIAGIVSAALVTRWLLPQLLPAGFRVRNTTALGRRLRVLVERSRFLRWPALAWVAMAVLLLGERHAQLWNHELLALSPVPAEAQAIDTRLRAALAAPDVRHLVVVRAPTAQAALERCERLLPVLEQAVAHGVLSGFEAPCSYLPSVALQLGRRAVLPPPGELRARMSQALAGLPLKMEAIEPFFADVEAARTSKPLERPDVERAAFAAALDATLVEVRPGLARDPSAEAHWNALVQLRAPAQGTATAIDAAKLQQWLAPLLDADTALLDLKRSSDDLYRDYMNQALRLSGLGLLAIAGVLGLHLRSVRRVAAVGAPLLAAVATVAAGLHLGGLRLNLLHLVGLLLTVAVGSNYALFFDAQNQPQARDERIYASLLFASLTTVAGFGVLAFSDVPVLSAIGVTVGPGSVCALVFSAILSGSLASRAGR